MSQLLSIFNVASLLLGRSYYSIPQQRSNPKRKLVKSTETEYWHRKTTGYLFYVTSSFVHHFKSIGEFKLELQSRNAQFGSTLGIFCPRDLVIWWMTLENNKAPLLYYVKLCASFQIHRWIQTWVTVWKRSTRLTISNFLSPVTLKFDGWPWKTIGHLFYTTLSFVHHFKAIDELQLELHSGNAQFLLYFNWGKNRQFLSRVTLKFDGWPWKTIEHLFYAASSFVHHFTAIIEFKLEL